MEMFLDVIVAQSVSSCDAYVFEMACLRRILAVTWRGMKTYWHQQPQRCTFSSSWRAEFPLLHFLPPWSLKEWVKVLGLSKPFILSHVDWRISMWSCDFFDFLQFTMTVWCSLSLVSVAAILETMPFLRFWPQLILVVFVLVCGYRHKRNSSQLSSSATWGVSLNF